jgi:alcohol dehydrogenase class IV
VRAGLAEDVAGIVGPGLVGVFDGSREHTPEPVVLDAAAAAGAAGADCLVSLGGSSVVDLAKGAALVLAERRGLAELRTGGGGPRAEVPKLPHVALPTTLSGAEFTGAAGITNLESGEKLIYFDRQLTPRWVVFDPDLARATPAGLWAGTGMKVVADTIEVLCSPRANPLSDVVALAALAMLVESLGPASAEPADLAARGRCQFAVAMALPQLAAVGIGLVAALRHQLGGGLGVPHGVASTIVLPHVLHWNSSYCGEPLGRAAAALQVERVEGLVGRLVELTAALGLPGRLRDVGVARAALPGVAEHALRDPAVRNNPRPVTDGAEVLEVLENAW